MKYYIHTINFRKQAILLLTAAMLGLGSCSSDADAPTEKATVENPDGDAFVLTLSQFNSSKMQLSKLEKHDFFQTVQTNGIFDVPPKSKASVSAYFGGYVVDINLLPGEKVKKGQILFTLENPDYLKIQQEFLEAKSQLSYLKSNYERQKNLVEDNVTSEKNYLKAEADYAGTRIRYESLRKKLMLMHINPDKLTVTNIHTIISVPAPISGYVNSVNITNGIFLNPEDVAITIINTDHLHLELNIFEKDLAYVKVGQPIKFSIQDAGNREFDAFVYLVNKSIDPENRMVAVHGHLTDEENTDSFSPGMYVEAKIYTSSTSFPSLPIETVVDVENREFVLVKKSSDDQSITFERREVKTGETTEGFIEILNFADFEPDAEFLSRGAFNLITD